MSLLNSVLQIFHHFYSVPYVSYASLFLLFFYSSPTYPTSSACILWAYTLFWAICFTLLSYTSWHARRNCFISSTVSGLFTILLSYLFLKEAIHLPQIIGICVALLGLITLASSQYMQNTQTIIPVLPLFFVLTAGLSWGMGNICNKVILKNGQTKTLSLVAWGGLFPIFPFLICSFIFEGKTQIEHSLSHFSFKDVMIVMYLSVICSLIGYSLWGHLLHKYETWKVAPLTLLVPVVGLISAFIFLNEVLSIQQFIGTLIVILGLCINVFGARIFKKIRSIYN